MLWTRNKFVKTAGWLLLGTSGMGAIAWARLVRAKFPPLQRFDFKALTVAEHGKITQHSPGQAQFFVEDLGNKLLFRNQIIPLEMIQIPAGKFSMGAPTNEPGQSNNEGPLHEVAVQLFYMSKFPVTQAQYEAIVGHNPAEYKAARNPVETVSWYEAIEFCHKLSQYTGRPYRLPTEAEWEYACRAGTQTAFHFGATATSELANYRGTQTYRSEPKGIYRQRTTEIGRFPPNAFGLYGMHGNVWEWCEDSWSANYISVANDGKTQITRGNTSDRLLRGGSWVNYPENCRSAARFQENPNSRRSYIGFRVVCSA